MAEIAWEHFHATLEQEKQTLLRKLLQMHRSSVYDLSSIAGLIGGYASLEDLELRLKKTILQGRKDYAGILQDGSTSTG
jgi:hypothetical protein